VTDALLLDTRIALWLDSGDDRLRASTRALIDRCWQNGGTIFLSAVTVWGDGSSVSSIARASRQYL
jgi:PIN domain nuclease of toxin-antitoxin system